MKDDFSIAVDDLKIKDMFRRNGVSPIAWLFDDDISMYLLIFLDEDKSKVDQIMKDLKEGVRK